MAIRLGPETPPAQALSERAPPIFSGVESSDATAAHIGAQPLPPPPPPPPPPPVQLPEAWASSRAAPVRGPPTGGGVQLLDESLLTVRIPRFKGDWAVGVSFTPQVGYTIVVEHPGATHTVVKRYSEFEHFHKQLCRKPFAASLPALPVKRVLANFDSKFLEKRRQQLEAYLSFLCLHSLVLKDGLLLSWLEVRSITQVIVRLVVAHMFGNASGVAQGITELATAFRGGQDPGCCIHPLVLGALHHHLTDSRTPATELAETCRALEYLLVDQRARQLFLERGGVAALLHVYQHGDTTAEAVQRVFEAICMAADIDGGPQTSVGKRRAAPSAGEVELGECCICCDKGKSHAFLPCGHLCVCMDCAAFLVARKDSCPICRRSIERATQIFV